MDAISDDDGCKMLRRGLRILPLLLAASVVLSGCDDGEPTGVKVGQRPPALAVEVVQDPAGRASLDLGSYRGKILVLGFWLGGCAPCLDEMPELVALQEARAAEDVEVLLVNVGGNRDLVEQVVREFDLGFGMAIDQLSLTASRYEVAVFPTLFVLDREGVIRARLAGRRPGQIAKSVAPLL